MSVEQQPEQEKKPAIPQQPIVKVQMHLGRAMVNMSRENASLFTFYEPYSYMRHIYQKHNGVGTYYFDPTDEMLMAAARAKFTEIKAAQPTEADVVAYEQYQDRKLMQELQQFGENDG